MSQVTSDSILYPLSDGIGSVALVQHVGDDKAIVNAARVSFGGDSDGPMTPRDEKLIGYLLREHHGSPFEHNSLTFKVIAPIFVVRQWMRHRIASYNEISGRYVEVKEEIYTPAEFRQQAASNRQASVAADETLDQAHAHVIWQDAWRGAYAAYQNLLALGVTREQARGVLPLALYTEMYFTCNVRALLHFIELRDHPGAQWEMVQYARALKALARPLFPTTFSAWEKLRAADS